MDKKIAGLLGAVAGLATMGAAEAAVPPAPNPSEALKATSYADLLAPVENAVAVLKADDAARTQKPAVDTPDDFQVAQAYYPYPPYAYRHHHHHHHHRYYRRYSHHHHHHHHNSAFIGLPGVGGVVVGGR